VIYFSVLIANQEGVKNLPAGKLEWRIESENKIMKTGQILI
jgi:hypothetical protein